MTQDTITFAQISDIAHDIRNSLDYAYRQNGEGYIKFEDNAPDWMRDICFKAHDSMWPSDDTYQMFSKVIESLALTRQTGNDTEDLDNARLDISCDIIYTNDILDWLKARQNRLFLADQILKDNGLDDIIQAIQMAWVEEKDHMFEMTLNAIREHIANNS